MDTVTLRGSATSTIKSSSPKNDPINTNTNQNQSLPHTHENVSNDLPLGYEIIKYILVFIVFVILWEFVTRTFFYQPDPTVLRPDQYMKYVCPPGYKCEFDL